ncbi:DUF1552 domain-containing protein [Verrucomicrobium spinosum]|uniref:DUF1552 domain-containing protein n=1 Tax=Verrucomicrobium spinosum TaxID=2736 RepID=UPI001C458CA7|nr:DUF1552 domain-containing protein [Verrucomicrobium spinosum]
MNVWLTGGKLGPSDKNTISVDQKMAEITAQHTRYPSLEVAITQESLAWTADGVRLPAMRRCSEIFASMFEEPKGGIAAQRRALRRKGSVLDDNLAEVRRMEKKMGSQDKGRMDQYLTSVREAEIRTRRADAWLDTPLPTISDTDRQRTNRDIADTKAGDYFRTVYDLMVLAFQTDVTRVATFSLGGEGQAIAIPEIGITESRHQLSHHGGDQATWRSSPTTTPSPSSSTAISSPGSQRPRTSTASRCLAPPCPSLAAACPTATAMATPTFRWCSPVARISG